MSLVRNNIGKSDYPSAGLDVASRLGVAVTVIPIQVAVGTNV
jgi:hypothetical protein